MNGSELGRRLPAPARPHERLDEPRSILPDERWLSEEARLKAWLNVHELRFHHPSIPPQREAPHEFPLRIVRDLG